MSRPWFACRPGRHARRWSVRHRIMAGAAMILTGMIVTIAAMSATATTAMTVTTVTIIMTATIAGPVTADG